MIRDLPGADTIIEWFGEFPSFHDAEIEELLLSRRGTSRIRVVTSRRLREVDANGHYLHDRRAVVSIELEDVEDLELADFSRQNVVGSITVEKREDGFRIEVWPLFGIGGWLRARRVRFSLTPLGD